ncbi:hypothetical protein TTHERM_000207258 (macronuclear) [Tetrahymena thermophila SB210]|uniref:Uncharacterized protein n=1 Tax=Tetrahymena thermophila (strain SB210) TaxID=312017 RepID=W7XLP7_TETTS|nr:hypothetical protein TTHERM_000207258 [Tetrahymena thermophila SB210]EWS76659.1 hypothetical protein TTHERM_000207258 [Tetrahymena thermophila SB210]|eukprot:XP_012650827.1 hypothetical protein TTHERM_000207258 [Tetrahymena thermophila SB210]
MQESHLYIRDMIKESLLTLLIQASSIFTQKLLSQERNKLNFNFGIINLAKEKFLYHKFFINNAQQL